MFLSTSLPPSRRPLVKSHITQNLFKKKQNKKNRKKQENFLRFFTCRDSRDNTPTPRIGYPLLYIDLFHILLLLFCGRERDS